MPYYFTIDCRYASFIISFDYCRHVSLRLCAPARLRDTHLARAHSAARALRDAVHARDDVFMRGAFRAHMRRHAATRYGARRGAQRAAR